MVKTVGIVAGDEFCYGTFQAAFDPVIKHLHTGYDLDSLHTVHPTIMSPQDVIDTNLDTHICSVTFRASRNLSCKKMPPACSKQERRDIEEVLIRVFANMPSEFAHFRYCPLRGSCSQSDRTGDISEKDEAWLENLGLLPDMPESGLLLSAGVGRHWPDARGVFIDKDATLAGIVNDEDHLELVVL